MSRENNEIYEFGNYRLDVGDHLLERLDGSPVAAIPEKAFQTLIHLVRNQGRLVTKDELFDAVWPDAIVEENNLGKAIHAIRRVLEERPGEKVFVQTVPKHGYRFISEVRTAEAVIGEHSMTNGSGHVNGSEHGILGASPHVLNGNGSNNTFEIVQQAQIKYQQMTAPTTIEARELVNKALRVDPDFTLAHCLSAELTTLEVIVGLKRPEAGFAEARSSIARADELRADSADFYAAAAYVDLIADWNFASAEEKLRVALTKNRHYTPANRMLGEALMFQGRHEEAAVFIKRAQSDTGFHNINILAISHFLARNYPAVLEVCEEMLALSPQHIIPAWTKCWALEQMGRADEAIAGYEQILARPSGEPVLRWFGYAYAKNGDRERALDIAARIEKASEVHNISPTHLAAIYAGLGEIDLAVPYLDKGLQMRDPFMLWVPTDPRFDNLRGDSRFNVIVERVLEKARPSSSINVSSTSSGIRITPSVQNGGNGLGGELAISTAKTQSGAFVISAKWPPANVPAVSIGEESSVLAKNGRLLTTPVIEAPASVTGKLRLWWVFATVAILGAVGLGYYFSAKPIVSSGQLSIAVLPFKPIDSASRSEIFELGTAESMINQLAIVSGLVVRPLHATRKYVDIAQDPVAAGKEQKVDFVLASNYQMADGRVRVTAELYNVKTGHIEETYRSDGAGDLFAMQDVVVGNFASKLLTRFSLSQSDRTAKRGTKNEEAFRLYLQGKSWTSLRTAANAKKAIKVFEDAIRLDPNYARAYAGMAYAYRASGTLGGGEPRKEFERAKAAVAKALELDPNLAEAYAVRGDLKHKYDWDWAGAERDFLRAIELEPNNDMAHEIYATLLVESGRFDEGFKELEIALAINPGSLSSQRDVGRFLYFSRRYDEAIDQLKRVIELNENFGTAYAWLWFALDIKDDHAGAYEWFMKSQQFQNPDLVDALQKAYVAGGWQAVKRKRLELHKLTEHLPNSSLFAMARLSAMLGEKDQAYHYLNKAIDKRHSQLVMLYIDPAFDPIRDDPRYYEMLKRVGF